MIPKYVICCGMRRSGSTLQYQLAKAILAAARVDCPVLKTHRMTAEQKRWITAGDAKCLYIYRDIRDVVVSQLNLNRWAFSFVNVCGSEIIGEGLQAYREWMKVKDIYISRYEVVVANLKDEVSRMAAYLECDLGVEDIAQIAAENSIETMRARLRKNAEDDALVLDRNTHLFNRHIHSGQAGQYRTALSALQIKWIEILSYDWLVSKGYPVSISRWFHVVSYPIVLYLYHFLRWRQAVMRSNGTGMAAA